jgi:hypothetical protein
VGPDHRPALRVPALRGEAPAAASLVKGLSGLDLAIVVLMFAVTIIIAVWLVRVGLP